MNAVVSFSLHSVSNFFIVNVNYRRSWYLQEAGRFSYNYMKLERSYKVSYSVAFYSISLKSFHQSYLSNIFYCCRDQKMTRQFTLIEEITLYNMRNLIKLIIAVVASISFKSLQLLQSIKFISFQRTQRLQTLGSLPLKPF